MEFVAFLVLFPFVVAALLACSKNNGVRKVVVYAGSAIIIAAAIYYSVTGFLSGETAYYFTEAGPVNIIMMCGEVFLMCLIVVLSIKHKKILPIILSVTQTGLMLWFELLAHKPEAAEEAHYFMLSDKLTLIMCLIVAVVGCLICVYAVGYLKDYHGHHTEYKDRRSFFCAMLFVFLGAMFGLIFSDNLIWMYFFWEITSVSSFLLIGYTKTEEAVTNSFRALWMNLLGGLGFCLAIIYCELSLGIASLSGLLASGLENSIIVLPVILLAFAALTKSAQFPFSKWLLGAMVAPTPSSALLHSATMVKAGVYLLLRLAPVMEGNVAGTMVSLIGGITFFAASVLAITQSDGKSVLAYSTISNLGLITACAGVGTKEAVWAGALLVIFHAVSKSLLFQTVGSVEHTIGSRDIEDMTGLVRTYPVLAGALTIGIAGMFLAPFGMLISKWAVLKSVLDAGGISTLIVILIVFGSATTLFYWTKWLCKILVQAPKDKQKNKTSCDQLTSIGIHAFLMIALCIVFPLIATNVLEPMIANMFGVSDVLVLSAMDMVIMVVMLVMVFAIPFICSFFAKNAKVTEAKEYIAGINVGTNDAFVDSFYNEKPLTVSNWYMGEMVNVNKWMLSMTWLGSAIIVVFIILAAGGAL
ncbi:MAG: NADH-quinone oxidoreductase subunit L [Lachnospiraceae bacterium]|nr:NADH-quinone oxidoreductase subunit L [Lachnospiraceae bacterium]